MIACAQRESTLVNLEKKTKHVLVTLTSAWMGWCECAYYDIVAIVRIIANLQLLATYHSNVLLPMIRSVWRVDNDYIVPKLSAPNKIGASYLSSKFKQPIWIVCDNDFDREWNSAKSKKLWWNFYSSNYLSSESVIYSFFLCVLFLFVWTNAYFWN